MEITWLGGGVPLSTREDIPSGQVNLSLIVEATLSVGIVG